MKTQADIQADDEEIARHEESVKAAFKKVLSWEQKGTELRTEAQREIDRLAAEIAKADTALNEAWAELKTLREETGETEIIIKGAATDYKIYEQEGRYSTKVEDVEAVPEQFVKTTTTKKPMLKEIGEHLDALETEGKPLPNWAVREKGPSKWTWKPLKKKKET